MCATFEFRGRVYRPGRLLIGRSAESIVRPVWAGFARNEILPWWLRQGGLLLDLPADRFAERSGESGKLVWDEVPRGFVLRGVTDPRGSRPVVRIVTRASTSEELLRFHHPRMPLLETPIHGQGEFPCEEESGDQGVLF